MRPANLVRYRIEVHTVTLRAYGTLHTRAGVPMTRILNGGDRPHLSLTHAHLYASGVEQPPVPQKRLYSTGFAAIPRDAIMRRAFEWQAQRFSRVGNDDSGMAVQSVTTLSGLDGHRRVRVLDGDARAVCSTSGVDSLQTRARPDPNRTYDPERQRSDRTAHLLAMVALMRIVQ